MKIHIVKKGDTLWNIAKMYHVDFEELKQMNAHLAEPDMIMPGMKIRIPVHKKEMKQETKEHKSNKNEKAPSTRKEEKHTKQKSKEHVPQQTKPVEQLKEDDQKDIKPVKPVVPFEQQKAPTLHTQPMPTLPKMPDYPHISPVEEEKVEKKEKPKKKHQPDQPKQEQKQEEVVHPKQPEMQGQSIPLTSYGCHCYCGSCTPMHFGESHMHPAMHQQQQQAPMMPAHPYGYQMMPRMPMQQPVMSSMYDQTYQSPYQPYNMQQMPYMQMPYVQEQETREAQAHSPNQVTEERREQRVPETYPPMYSEQAAHRSHPTPPGFHSGEQINNEENK